MNQTDPTPQAPIQSSKPSGPRSSLWSLGAVSALFLVAGVVSPTLASETSPTSMKWRQDRRVEILEEVREALEHYKSENGAYPDTEGQWRGDCETFGGFGYDADGYIPNLAPVYMAQLPRDPDPRYPYFNAGVAYRSDGKDYKFLLFHTPEAYPEGNEFEDFARPFWAWQVSTPGAEEW